MSSLYSPTRRDYSAGMDFGDGGWLVDVVILNDAPPTLAAAIVTAGARVYYADAELDHEFRRDAQIRAADIEPFLRKFRQTKLEAIRFYTACSGAERTTCHSSGVRP